EQDWVWITPGSLVAATLWLVGSLGFRFYAVNFGNYEATYGAIGGVILLLLWFFLSGLVIVVGAEMNAEIEHGSPWGKAPGEKVRGKKKKLGAAASRANRNRPRALSPVLASGSTAASIHPATYPPPAWYERLLAYLALAVRWRSRTKD